MKDNAREKRVWIGREDLKAEKEWIEQQTDEFPSTVAELLSQANEELGGSRRDFLRMLGFGISAAALASCEIPVKKALPYVVKPEEIIPGEALWYASTFVQGGDFCPILVKTREGRPIKIEGNGDSPITGGGTSARAQAVLLTLYDSNRIQGPGRVEGKTYKSMTWQELDDIVKKSLKADAQIRVLSHTDMSPSLRRAWNAFVQKYPNAKWIQYDPVSSTALLEANEADFGIKAVPRYAFDRAKVIVSFGADFLGTWISPVEYAAQYAKGRGIDDFDGAKPNKHIQVEGYMSFTGSNADVRILIKPSQIGAAILHLYNAIARAKGAPTVTAPSLPAEVSKKIGLAAEELLEKSPEVLVVCGTNNVAEQRFVNAINHLLGAYGTTIHFDRLSFQRKGDDRALRALLKEMRSGKVDALFVMGANPAYDTPFGEAFAAAMKNVSLTVGLDTHFNETNVQCQFIAPIPHLLESWGDCEPVEGMIHFVQPVVHPFFHTREAGASLLTWAESPTLPPQAEQPYYDFIKSHYVEKLGGEKAFHDALKQGFVVLPAVKRNVQYAGIEAPGQLASKVTMPAKSEYEIAFFENISVGNGQYANNPWLMELPDPVTRCSWGNYLQVPVHFDGKNDFISIAGIEKNGEYLELTIGKQTVQLPVFQQFGQQSHTLSMALGYGRTMAGPTGTGYGHNMYPFLTEADGLTQYFNTAVQVGKATGEVEKHFACVQFHHTFGVKAKDENGQLINADEAAIVSDDWKAITSGYQGALTDRSIVYYSTVDERKELAEHIKHKREEAEHLNQQTLYPYDKYVEKYYSQGHHWEMYVDTNKCTGCGACVVACMAENNVPVVGKREVSRHHEMTWLRIDRYFFGDVDNPNTFYQPMLCQHCDNAPCENVCPVNATNHSSEGLNQMAYNRCIGTRYCANNCPYKVRRFNWLDYTTADLFKNNEFKVAQEGKPLYTDSLLRLVFNPDVVVRSRGVIEKCSFCVQRIQAAKLEAKKERRPLKDGDVVTACQAACPTGAIVFGDGNDKDSQVSKKKQHPLSYYVLEEINVRPSVMYRAKVVNKKELA